jgi:2-hydroxychromene-2-carboxylate isomerase
MGTDARPIRWYHDFISPFAYLHWPRVRTLMASGNVELVPVLFGAILDAVGQKGPAEIPAKRVFTYRDVVWRARRAGVPLRFPDAHPFNPLAALRLVLAAGNTAEATTRIYDWIWAEGRRVDDPVALAPLVEALGLEAGAVSDAAAKAALRANTGDAIAAGVFGVPTLAVGDALFWGGDAHDFALAAIADPQLLEDDGMRRVAALPVGIQRR